MAWLNANAVFDPDLLGVPVVGIAAKLAEHDSGQHQHKMGQLLFTQSGCIRITLRDRLCMLPPTRVAWIPPQTIHRAEMKDVVGYRSIYLDQTLISALPRDVAVFEVNPLLREVFERIALAPFKTKWQQGAEANLLAVCLDELRVAHQEPMILQLPSDRRLAHFSGNELPPLLNILAMRVGASEKTISRIFQQETGLSYQQWRQQWRYLKSIELLSKRSNMLLIAHELGFASDSAFVAFFKKMSGLTPREYIPAPKASSRFIRSSQ